MKRYIKICLLALASAFFFTSCVEDMKEEITSLGLKRCLEPMGLGARVTGGNNVTFRWDVTKDASSYNLVVASDESFGTIVLETTINAENVPFTEKLEADATFYYKVQATNSQAELESSKWAVYEKSIKTYAVKDNLYLEAIAKTSTSVSLAWSTEVPDYKELDRVEYYATKSADEPTTVKLDAQAIEAGTSTVSGLTPSTEYTFTLYYKSAMRGEITVYTEADTQGFTEVGSIDELRLALATPDVKIHLLKAGSPYVLNEGEVLDIPGSLTIAGEQGVDGSYPAIHGEFHILGTAHGKISFEGIELNGVSSKYGFPVQLKNGGNISTPVALDELAFRNCVITGYAKGLIYEWGQSFNLSELVWDSCDINNINSDGTGGGDVIDFRGTAAAPLSALASIRIVNNTISTGGRTFLRIDFPSALGKIEFENNTLYNICVSDNSNNAGIIAIQTAPTQDVTFKNNLILGMGANAKLGSEGTVKEGGFNGYKYWNGVTYANNWYYDVQETFFNKLFLKSSATALEANPCQNPAAGLFNITNSDLVENKVGAPKWWTPYVEKPEDLTLAAIEGAHTWNLSDAKYFSGTIKKEMVRDLLYINGTEDNLIIAENGMLNFTAASLTKKNGLPTAGYLAFKVAEPGSVLVKADGEGKGHVIVGVGNVEGSSINVKGGAAAISEANSPTKIPVTDITEESLIYVYVSDATAISKLAWSTDVSPVNTALPAPAPKATPSSMTAGEATDIVISWESVPNAGGYSAVFNGKTFAVAEGETTYTVEGKTTGMLDAGSYTVAIYANPSKSDIYNTMSEAGVAAFAVLPAGGSDEGDSEFIVSSYEELLSAIDAGKSEITLASGEYTMEASALEVTAPLSLKGQDGAVINGAFKLSGEVGSFRLDNLTIKDKDAGIFINLLDTGVNASEIVVENCVLDGFSKSAIYSNFENANVDKVAFLNDETHNWGTGQGIFDFRKGIFGEIDIMACTIVGGRDMIRVDATVQAGVIRVTNNTIDGVTLGNGNGVLYVRASANSYVVANNLFLNEVAENKTTLLSKAAGVAVPSMRNNLYYNVDEAKFFSGLITREIATGNGGAVLSANPVKNAAKYDYTLVSGLAMSNRVGAPKWNPSYNSCDETSFVVKSADEFLAALDAGKTEITLSAEGSPYTFEPASFELVKNFHLNGEVKDGKYPEFHGVFTISGTEDLGEVIFENVRFAGDGEKGVLIEISGSSAARNIIMRNCEVDGFTKSVIYGNGEVDVQAAAFRNVTVSNHGTGQGVFDIRKGKYGIVSIENSTVTGGRDLVRADPGTITGAFNFVNNTICKSNVGVNGNGIMYVRATPEVFKFSNNLFLNEVAENKTVMLSKASGVTVPTVAANNFFYNVDTENFFKGLMNKETSAAIELSYDPCRNSADGDYTLTDALCLGSNVGARRWNPNAGQVTTEFTASNIEELLTAIEAGKTSITLKYGTYDFTAVADNASISAGSFTISAPLTIKGEKKAGLGPEIIGGFKFATGMSEFVAQGIRFSGNEKKIGNLLEVASTLETSRIMLRDCEIYGYDKSLIYGNAEGAIGSASFDRLIVHDMGTGQGMFDLRKKIYGSLIIENSTIYNGGRDFVRCDPGVGESICIRNNTLAYTGINAGNGLFWVRSDISDKYVVENNLFLNETGSTLLAKTGAKKAIFKNNWYFNLGENFWGGTYSIEEGTANGGGVLEADPCQNSAEFQFNLTNETLKSLKVGDPRWR